ncbi:hypothetical protein ALP39_200347 [Pseudomonas marginalis pv. marginalis]|nr:hypothetical protein ALP39_200347 [Pseudomonas marginalis pv. marginalis]
MVARRWFPLRFPGFFSGFHWQRGHFGCDHTNKHRERRSILSPTSSDICVHSSQARLLPMMSKHHVQKSLCYVDSGECISAPEPSPKRTTVCLLNPLCCQVELLRPKERRRHFSRPCSRGTVMGTFLTLMTKTSFTNSCSATPKPMKKSEQAFKLFIVNDRLTILQVASMFCGSTEKKRISAIPPVSRAGLPVCGMGFMKPVGVPLCLN